MSKGWTLVAYTFYDPVPEIVYIKNHCAYEFSCLAKRCKYKCRHFLDKKDATSTGSLIKHIKSCWGMEVWDRAYLECGNADTARENVVKGFQKTGSIFKMFQRAGKQQVTYSHRQHTRAETKAEIVRWIAESVRLFRIVEDRGFHCLMKTGRPDYWIPSASTVVCDVRLVFGRCRDRIGKMLQDYEGRISFAMDAWTSPNHRAYVAVTTHFEVDGVPISIVLNVVEVPDVRTLVLWKWDQK
ncbi:hypothetical protein FPV67DRAFT_1414440 [Lyophyllum atratum]|nr:hypothetical protein FPV67DRAFT_1414440 [Lyophyllum atratum]